MIVDADMDIIQKLAQWHFEKNEEKKVFGIEQLTFTNVIKLSL